MPIEAGSVRPQERVFGIPGLINLPALGGNNDTGLLIALTPQIVR